MKKVSILLTSILLALLSQAQEIAPTPIGQWTPFYSYNEVTDMVEDGSTFFIGSQSGFYTYNKNTGEIEAYNKISGMATPGIACLGHDLLTSTTIIGYLNSQIDLFQNGNFYNIPYLYLTQTSGNKDINKIVCHNGEAFICTGKGLITINLEKKEIKETIIFYENNTELIILSAAILGNDIYVSTTAGLYKTPLNNPSFIYYGSWDKVSNEAFTNIETVGNTLFLHKDDQIFKYENNNFTTLFSYPLGIKKLYTYSSNQLGISISHPNNANTSLGVYHINTNGSIADSIMNRPIIKSYKNDAGVVYLLINKLGLTNESEKTVLAPNAMPDFKSADVAPYNGDFAVAHGGHGESYRLLNNPNPYTIFQNGIFKTIEWVSDDYTFSDFIRIVRNPANGSYFSSAFGGHISELTKDFSPISHYGNLEPRKGETPPKTYSYGLAFDKKNNLWIVNNGTDRLLKVKTPDNQWYASAIITNPLTASLQLPLQSAAGDLVIDGNENMWIVPINVNGGIIAYNANGTPENNTDDYYRVFQAGKGLGGLPSNKVLCVAADRNNDVWIGTDNGIAIYNCSYDLRDNCDVELRTIENEKDNILGKLFEGITINALAVDGANRKWVGTPAGLWLISSDGRTTINQFTIENSPLPSNNIKRINIDPINGDVYISTDLGLIRYRGTATAPRAKVEKPLTIYPNPVPSTFGGQIAINGLPFESDVRIVDMNGQLVYRTKSLGGQAIWDGNDYLGKRAQSGVYIVMVRTKDGVEKASGKILFNE